MLKKLPVILFAILLLAAVMRLAGLAFGLPNDSRPDEEIFVVQAMNILHSFASGKPDLNPRLFLYPSFYTYVLTFVYAVYFALGSVSGNIASTQSFFQNFLNDSSTLFLISRGVSAVFGILTVWASYQLGQALGLSRKVGLIAALLLAVAFLHVRDSHFGTTDVAVTFWITLCLWQAVVFCQTTNKGNIIFAAGCAGLAAATKYPGVLVLISCILACSVVSDRREKIILLLKIFATTALVFFLASPFVVLDAQQVMLDLRYQFSYALEKAPANYYQGKQHIAGWWYHLAFSLWYGLGPVNLVLAAIGLGFGIRADFHKDNNSKAGHVVVLGFLVFYFAFIGFLPAGFVRYMVPLTPILCVYSAIAVCALAALSSKYKIPSWTALTLLTIAAVLVPFSSSVSFDMLCRQKDTRILAREWLINHSHPGDAVGVGQPFAIVNLPLEYRSFVLYGQDSIFHVYQASDLDPQARLYLSRKPVVKNTYGVSTYTDADLLKKLGMHYLVITKSPLAHFPTPESELTWLATHDHLVAHFVPYKDNPPSADCFDQLDCLYIPFRKIRTMSCAGPEIFIYKLP